MAKTRIATGIDGLDPLLEDRFLPAKSYVVTGDAGTGKTTACLQFLLKGLENGEKGGYVTVADRPSDIWTPQPRWVGLAALYQDKGWAYWMLQPYFSARAGAVSQSEVDVHESSGPRKAYYRMQRSGGHRPVGPRLGPIPRGRSEEQARC